MSCLATIFISPGCDEILHYSQAVQRFLNRKDFPPASNTVLTQSFFYSPIPKNLVKGKSSQLNFRNAGATAKQAPEQHNFLNQILPSEDWNAPSPARRALNSKRMGKTLVLALQETSKQTSSLTSCKQPHKPRATHTPGPHPLTRELTPVTHLCTLLVALLNRKLQFRLLNCVLHRGAVGLCRRLTGSSALLFMAAPSSLSPVNSGAVPHECLLSEPPFPLYVPDPHRFANISEKISCYPSLDSFSETQTLNPILGFTSWQGAWF